MVETAPSMPRIRQFSVFVITEEQRAEGASGCACVGPPANDELLLLDDLQLSPVTGALPCVIDRARVFRDEPFPPMIERVLKQRARITRDNITCAQNRGA